MGFAPLPRFAAASGHLPRCCSDDKPPTALMTLQKHTKATLTDTHSPCPPQPHKTTNTWQRQKDKTHSDMAASHCPCVASSARRLAVVPSRPPVPATGGFHGAAVGPCRPATLCRYGTGRRIFDDEKDNKADKIARMAEVFGCTEADVNKLVSVRPGLLLAPSMDFFRHKLYSVSTRHNISQRQASQMILTNPTLLFEP